MPKEEPSADELTLTVTFRLVNEAVLVMGQVHTLTLEIIHASLFYLLHTAVTGYADLHHPSSCSYLLT